MAFEDQAHPSKQGTAPPYPYHPLHRDQYPPLQGTTASVPNFAPPSSGYQSPNGQQHSRYANVNGSQQHPPLHSNRNQQQIPQKAYAVEIPLPSSSPNESTGYLATPSRPQPAHEALFRRSLNTGHEHTSKHAPSQMGREPPLDYQLLLLSLAEEYFAAAYGYGSMVAKTRQESDIREYYRLIATGLGCLEAVLGRFKLLPEREAIVRLRYATVLYEETENTLQAEEALGKGVSLCDRHRFFDLKYNMQHLLARMLFDKTSRAAFKFLDGIIKDVEAYQHIAWVYAFRFLKVSLHLKSSTHQDTLSALTQLRHIINMSNDYGDKTILAVATIMEALTCLRESSDADSIEQAQRALAGVRSLQLDPKINELRQLAVLTSIIDLCCQLQHYDPHQALAKMQIMQSGLKDMLESKTWAADGSFAIPIPNARMPSCKSRGGMVRKEEDGSLVLMFALMSKDDIYNLGYLLSGIALAHRNTQDGNKSEHMLEDGIRKLKYANEDKGKRAVPRSIWLAMAEQTWREQLICHMRLHLAFMLCARSSWSATEKQQSLIRTSIQSMTASLVPMCEALQRLPAHLEAVIYQATGDLELALNIYQSDTLSIQTYRKTTRPSNLHLNIALLSALNTLLIIRTPTHRDHGQLPSLLSFLEHLCVRNPNKQIQSAYHLVVATAPSSSTILLTKSALQSALQTAKQSENNQLICMVLNFMCWKFFRGVVGDQSEKSAQASKNLAQKCMDSLWMSVAAGVLGDTLEAAGRIEEAKVEREKGEVVAMSLPEKLQKVMRHDVGGGDETTADAG